MSLLNYKSNKIGDLGTLQFKANLVCPVEAPIEELTVKVDHVLRRKEDEQLFGRPESTFPEDKRRLASIL
jgi:hypothetical protein